MLPRKRGTLSASRQYLESHIIAHDHDPRFRVRVSGPKHSPSRLLYKRTSCTVNVGAHHHHHVMSRTMVLGPSGRSKASDALAYLAVSHRSMQQHVARIIGIVMAESSLDGLSDSQNVSQIGSDAFKTRLISCSGSTVSETYLLRRNCSTFQQTTVSGCA